MQTGEAVSDLTRPFAHRRPSEVCLAFSLVIIGLRSQRFGAAFELVTLQLEHTDIS